MKHDLTTGTWQNDTGCPISIILVTTSDVIEVGRGSKAVSTNRETRKRAAVATAAKEEYVTGQSEVKIDALDAHHG